MASKLLEKITPKLILLIWLGLFFAGVGFIYLLPLPYSDLLGIFTHAGLIITVFIISNLDLYTLKFCSLNPGFSPAQYSLVLYPCPFAILLGVIFLLALRKEKRLHKKVGFWWYLALITTVIVIVNATAELFNYFCYPIRF